MSALSLAGWLLLACTSALAQDEDSPHNDPERAAAASLDGDCTTCHTTSHHAIDLAPDKVAVPESFPLNDGQLSCVTCHDLPAADTTPVESLDALLLRGGPYDQVGGLCAQCHVATSEEQFNPHHEMASKPDEAESCTYCHLTPPADGKSDLKVDGPNICSGCHLGPPHTGAGRHLRNLPASIAKTATAAGLPLVDGKTVVCLTCHDPHPAARLERSAARAGHVGEPLFPEAWLVEVLGFPTTEAMTEAHGVAVEPDFLRAPLTGGELCTSCHTNKRIEAFRALQSNGRTP